MNLTPLNAWHREHHGRMVDFAGWEMPIQYTTIVEEHQAVRQRAGLFDISHMGRLRVQGSSAVDFLNRVTTIAVEKLESGRIRYALATNAEGGTRDDILVYRLEQDFLVVVNASNREKILEFWSPIAEEFSDLELIDETFKTAMIALQGPKAAEVLEQFCPDALKLRYYRCLETTWQGEPVLISRTGYTGEDGFEVIGTPEVIIAAWQQLADAGASQGVQACGLGCRDTLRLEAGMPLYGHELNETIDAYSAGLDFAVSKQKQDFIGAEALQQIQQSGLKKIRVGLQMEGKRIAREQAQVLNSEGEVIGEVTSGTFSPTLNQGIAMAFVSPEHAAIGTNLTIDIRGKHQSAVVCALPFYQRSKA